jgi:hypothetical protein
VGGGEVTQGRMFIPGDLPLSSGVILSPDWRGVPEGGPPVLTPSPYEWAEVLEWH